MDYFQDLTSAEQIIRRKADILRSPISGTFELTPLCNMDCRMCYVRMSPEEMRARGGRLRSAEAWITLGKECVEAGMMFLLLTGGEPFLHPEFITIYKALRRMGLVIMINSNGTLLTDDILQALIEDKPRRINISLYGSSDEVYGDLCRNPKGFTQVMNAVERLQNHGIDVRMNMAITPWNRNDFSKMIRIAEEKNIPITIADYVFPACRRSLSMEQYNKQRYSPEEVAQHSFDIFCMDKTEAELKKLLAERLADIEQCPPRTSEQRAGFTCRAGNSSFWVTWEHKLMPCGMLQEPVVDIQNGFHASWMQLRKEVDHIMLCSDCYHCNKREACNPCAAIMYAENGCFAKKPEYKCVMVDTTLKLYEQYLKDHEA